MGRHGAGRLLAHSVPRRAGVAVRSPRRAVVAHFGPSRARSGRAARSITRSSWRVRRAQESRPWCSSWPARTSTSKTSAMWARSRPRSSCRGCGWWSSRSWTPFAAPSRRPSSASSLSARTGTALATAAARRLFPGVACSSVPEPHGLPSRRHRRPSVLARQVRRDQARRGCGRSRPAVGPRRWRCSTRATPWWPRTDEERALCGTEQAERYDEDIWHQKVAAFVRDKATVRTHEVAHRARGRSGAHGRRERQARRRRYAAARLGTGAQARKRRSASASGVRGPEEEQRARVLQLFAGGASNVVQFPTGERAAATGLATTPQTGEAQQDDKGESGETGFNDIAKNEYRELLE